MIVEKKFEGVVGGELKKFSVGDTITKAEAKELNAEAKGFIKSEKLTRTQSKVSEEEKEDAKS